MINLQYQQHRYKLIGTKLIQVLLIILDTYIINNSKNTVSLNADRCIQNGTEISPESNTDYWDRSDDKFFRIGRSLSTSS